MRECFVVRRFIPIFLSMFLLFLCFLPRIVSFACPIGDFSVRRERVVGESSHRFVVQCALLRQVLARFASSRRAKFGTGASWRAVFGREDVRRFLFPLESRKKPCHLGENVEQNAAGDPGRKREKARRERQVIQPSRRLFASQAKINAETPCFVVTIH